MNDTKEKILEISLELFSQKGFSAVSIRDICKRVGIKESSVYYHFKNKQAIFDELLSCFQKKANEMMEQFNQALADGPSTINEETYNQISEYFFENYLMDYFCNRVIRTLMIDRFCNDDARQIYDRWIFNEPLVFQSNVFSRLMESGVIKKADSSYLATKYYAPIFLYAKRWLFNGSLSEDRKNHFREDAYKHIQAFFAELED